MLEKSPKRMDGRSMLMQEPRSARTKLAGEIDAQNRNPNHP